MYKLEVGSFMFSYFANSLPNSFNDFFTMRSDIHNYHTRSKNNLNPTRNKMVFSDKSIRTAGPILWNSLSDQFKTSNSNKHFRKQYKSYLISFYHWFWNLTLCVACVVVTLFLCFMCNELFSFKVVVISGLIGLSTTSSINYVLKY